jgi:hypothetical protein
MKRSSPSSHRSGVAPAIICRSLGAVAVALVLLGVSAALALADADPASDVLLAQNAFFPYQPPVEPRLEAAMNGSLEAAARAGMPLKVAIIGSPEDLGAVPEFFGHPQSYATFLDREISFNRPQPLLVVMAAGYGLAAAGPATALSGLPVSVSHGSYGLTRSAILAVVALARANGHRIPAPVIPSRSRSHESFPVALLFAIPAALLFCAGIFLLSGERSARARAPQPPPPFQRPRA